MSSLNEQQLEDHVIENTEDDDDDADGEQEIFDMEFIPRINIGNCLVSSAINIPEPNGTNNESSCLLDEAFNESLVTTITLSSSSSSSFSDCEIINYIPADSQVNGSNQDSDIILLENIGTQTSPISEYDDDDEIIVDILE